MPSSILEQHLVVLGKTGAGKSSVLRYLVEDLLRQKKRVCVVDPKGDWWGLKSSADGKGAGFPVIAFGDFKNAEACDVPVNAHSGRHVAELVATGNRPCIIGFRGWMTAHMVQFWIDFAAGIFNANQGELYVVGDEFHNFAPKGKIMDPQAGKCLHWSNRLLSEGRGLGIVCLLASQRPQKVHNDTLTSCETLIAMRVVHAADRGAVEEWIKGCGDKEKGNLVLSKLALMARGEAFVWSPEAGFGPERVAFPMFGTFDSFAAPQLQKKVSAKTWADVDLGAVKEKLAAVIEEAKANDPRELRKQLADARKQLADARGELEAAKARCGRGLCDGAALFSAKAVELKTRVKPVLAEGHLARIERYGDKLGEALVMIQASNADLLKALKELKTSDRPAPAATPAAEPGRVDSRAPLSTAGQTTFSRATPQHENSGAVAMRSAHRTPAGATGGGSEGQVTVPQRRILDALATLEGLGLRTPDKSNVAVFADQSPTSSGYANNLGRLRTLGLIDYPRAGVLALTPAGRELAQQTLYIATATDLHRAWYSKLASPKVRILEVLINHYPHAISKEHLAQQSGQSATSSGFANNLGNLRTLGLLDYPRAGEVVATALLFPEGLK